jgi:hypothetical protein
MIELRQRSAALLGVLAVALLGAACSSQAQPQPTTPPLTAVAELRATAQPLQTAVSGAAGAAGALASGVARLQPENVARLVGTTLGVQMTVNVEPANVENTQVQRATFEGTDQSGAFGKLDQPARRSFALAGLQLARQAYSQAQIQLTIVDPSGNRLLAVSQAPGGEATFQ